MGNPSKHKTLNQARKRVQSEVCTLLLDGWLIVGQFTLGKRYYAALRHARKRDYLCIVATAEKITFTKNGKITKEESV